MVALRLFSVGYVFTAVVLGTPLAAAEPTSVNDNTTESVSELAARWLGPSQPMAPAETAEEKVAAAIRLMISGGRRDGFDSSGSYHTQPGDTGQQIAETAPTR